MFPALLVASVVLGVVIVAFLSGEQRCEDWSRPVVAHDGEPAIFIHGGVKRVAVTSPLCCPHGWKELAANEARDAVTIRCRP